MKILSSLLTLTTCVILVGGHAHAADLSSLASDDFSSAIIGLPLIFGLCIGALRSASFKG